MSGRSFLLKRFHPSRDNGRDSVVAVRGDVDTVRQHIGIRIDAHRDRDLEDLVAELVVVEEVKHGNAVFFTDLNDEIVVALSVCEIADLVDRLIVVPMFGDWHAVGDDKADLCVRVGLLRHQNIALHRTCKGVGAK